MDIVNIVIGCLALSLAFLALVAVGSNRARENEILKRVEKAFQTHLGNTLGKVTDAIAKYREDVSKVEHGILDNQLVLQQVLNRLRTMTTNVAMAMKYVQSDDVRVNELIADTAVQSMAIEAALQRFAEKKQA